MTSSRSVLLGGGLGREGMAVSQERSGSSQRVGVPQAALPFHQVLLGLLEGNPPWCAPHNYTPGLVLRLPPGSAGKLRIRG